MLVEFSNGLINCIFRTTNVRRYLIGFWHRPNASFMLKCYEIFQNFQGHMAQVAISEPRLTTLSFKFFGCLKSDIVIHAKITI